MKFLKTYFHSLQRSFSEPAYYKELLSIPFWFSLRFFLLTLVSAFAISLLYWRFRDFPPLFATLENEINRIIETLPENATFSYEKGKLTTDNIALPFVIHSSETLAQLEFPKNLITITSDTPPDPSFLTLYPDRMEFIETSQSESSPRSTLPYVDILPTEPFTLTQSDILAKKEEALAFVLKLANMGLLIASPFLALAVILSTLISLSILTLFSQIVAWGLGIRLTYKKVFQLGLHAMSVAYLIEVIQHLLIPNSTVSLMIPAFIGIMILVLWELRRQKGSFYG